MQEKLRKTQKRPSKTKVDKVLCKETIKTIKKSFLIRIKLMSNKWRSDKVPYYRCKDIGLDCAFETFSESYIELEEKIKSHAKVVHKWSEIPDHYKKKIGKSIHEKF
jgi:predicted small metal-binding protein